MLPYIFKKCAYLFKSFSYSYQHGKHKGGRNKKTLVWSEVIYMNKNVVLTFFLELKITHT
jgi:hypothetical protein